MESNLIYNEHTLVNNDYMAKKLVVGYCGNAEIFDLSEKKHTFEHGAIIRLSFDQIRKLIKTPLDEVHGYIEFQAWPHKEQHRKPYKSHSVKLIIDAVK